MSQVKKGKVKEPVKEKPDWDQEKTDLNNILSKANIDIEVTKGKPDQKFEGKMITFLVTPK